MPTAKAQLMRRVRRYLAIWAVNVGLDNRVGLTDINKEAEDFYCGLLNVVLGAKLRNLNLLKMDFPAIDLADEEKRICVQVTSTTGREKIDHTLDRFFHYELENAYDRLIVIIIGDRSKKKYRMDTLAKGRFTFDPEGDVWDMARLILEISGLETDRLKLADDYLQEQLGPLSEQPDPLNLPLRTAMDERNFVGRADELGEITERFGRNEQIVVLSGLGGMGKTELAVQFARQYDQGQTYFVNFRQDFRRTVIDEIALGVEGLTERKLDENTKYAEVMKVLSRCGRDDLLILDNADTEEASFEQLRRDLSVLPMRILITTRCDAVERIDVGSLEREELHGIFRLYNSNISEADMDALIKAVDSHTLTVDLMARSMRHGRRAATAEKLLTALNSRDLSSPFFMQIATNYPGGLKQARINEHLRTVFRVAELSEDEQMILRCATLLPAGGMSDELFMRPFAEEMQDVLDGLIQKGWLLWEDDLLKIHPVICIVCREELKPDEEHCADLLDALWGQIGRDEYDRVKFAQLAEVFANAMEIECTPQTKAEWLNSSGRLLNDLKESRRCAALYEAYLPVLEPHIPDRSALATAYNNVGLAYGALSDHPKAMEYQMKALTLWEKVLPRSHPALATSYNNVGSTYGALGDHKKALEYQQKTLTIREKVLSLDHPHLATSYNNVGFTYGALGDHKKALEYQLKALVIREKVLPSTHPDLAISCNNLAWTYYKMGNYDTALDYMRRAADIAARSLPEGHPHRAMYQDYLKRMEREARQRRGEE